MEMINLNNVEPSKPLNQDFELIPVGTIARASMMLKLGDIEIPEFGSGAWFKKSFSSNAKWCEIEFTVIGGEFDKRKFWQKIFIDGDALASNGMSKARQIGLSTLRTIIDSAKALNPSDTSSEAQNARNLSGIAQLNTLELCVKIGIEKGTNGYADRNKMMAALSPDHSDYISGNGSVQAAPSTQGATPETPPNNGVLPQWANR